MISDATISQSGARSSLVARPLKRGRACMNCRFLKIKCDGVKPVCGPCRKHPKDDECEYNDGPARSRTKALEDTVHRLEARLHELENPDASTPSVTLYDPYSTFPPPPPPGRLSIPHPHLAAFQQIGHRSLPGTPFGATLPRLLTPSTTPHSPESHLAALSPPSTTASTPPLFLSPSGGTSGHGSSPLGIFDSRSVATPDSDLHDPQLCDTLVQIFLPHASHFGFFLDPRVFTSLSPGTPPSPLYGLARTSPALLHTLCAFGAHLSSPTHPGRETEDRFVFRALQALATSPSPTSHPQNLLHAIQAEVLLSYYFWRTGVLLRARVHAASAGALVRGSGLHLRQHTDVFPVLELSQQEYGYDAAPAELRFPSPVDAADATTRLRAVWAVLGLQSMLGVALDPITDLCVGAYDRLAATVPLGESDSAGLLARAQVLLHRAAALQGQASSQPQVQVPTPVLQVIEQGIEDVRAQLGARFPSQYQAGRRRSYSPTHSSGSGSGSGGSSGGSAYSSPGYPQSTLSPVSAYSNRSPDYSMSELPQAQARARSHVPSPLSHPSTPPPYTKPNPEATQTRLAHALLDGALLRLHQLYLMLYGPGYSADASARAVRSALDLLRDASFHPAPIASNPVVGNLYASAIKLLGDELRVVQSQSNGVWAGSQDGSNYESELRAAVRDGLAGMQREAEGSVMMRWELGKARESVAGV